ncbi:MAG: T9SS type A sorting domain-containing protein [Bacteroidales bacterium]|jgi:hypothetical protein|nr:T9SS type A sorting domain-containing protein [Bacteroidales bacterium]
MKKRIYISIVLLLIIMQLQGQYISRVYKYMPAPGQHINALPWGLPSSANSIIGGIEGSLSLGAFGGYVVFGFEDAVVNDPDNPYGIDFTIFGNPITDASEPGVVYVMADTNANGLPDETWYLLAGSDYWFSTSVADYGVTYSNPGGHADVPWTDNLGNSGFIYANAIHEQAYYPGADSFPNINPVQYMMSGSMIEGAIDSSSPAFVRSPQRAFGYADNRLRGGQIHTLPDNPYTSELEASGGDAFDISWAVDSLGNYVELDSIHFIKVQTGMMGDLGWLGEISTEITGAVDVTPEPGTNYDLDMVVIKDLPVIIDTSSYPLVGFAFHAGRIQPEAELYWETNVSWAQVEDGLLISEKSGELEITAKLLSDPEINATITARVELPSGIPVFPHSRILIMPNPSNTFFKVSGLDDAFLQVYSLSGELLISTDHYGDGQIINTEALRPGLYLVKITTKEYTRTLKLIQQ